MSICANTTYALKKKDIISRLELANVIIALMLAPPTLLACLPMNMEGQAKYSFHLNFAMGLGHISQK
jgi:hypothetical protein